MSAGASRHLVPVGWPMQKLDLHACKRFEGPTTGSTGGYSFADNRPYVATLIEFAIQRQPPRLAASFHNLQCFCIVSNGFCTHSVPSLPEQYEMGKEPNAKTACRGDSETLPSLSFHRQGAGETPRRETGSQRQNPKENIALVFRKIPMRKSPEGHSNCNQQDEAA
jgi:hypothetical protein